MNVHNVQISAKIIHVNFWYLFWNSPVIKSFTKFIDYKKKRCMITMLRQLSTRDQNDTEINNYRSPYGLQQRAKSETAYSDLKSPEKTM